VPFFATHAWADAREKASVTWLAAERKVELSISDMVTVFEGNALLVNRFTRRKADVRGTSIHIGGLIKAESSGWTSPKFMSSLSTGGKRFYNIAIAIDLSMSIHGHLATCVMESLVIMIAALQRCGIDNFSILTFGSDVQILKTEDQPWDDATKLLLLSSLVFRQTATFDADAIFAGLALLRQSSAKGPKKLFVFTDGYGSRKKECL